MPAVVVDMEEEKDQIFVGYEFLFCPRGFESLCGERPALFFFRFFSVCFPSTSFIPHHLHYPTTTNPPFKKVSRKKKMRYALLAEAYNSGSKNVNGGGGGAANGAFSMGGNAMVSPVKTLPVVKPFCPPPSPPSNGGLRPSSAQVLSQGPSQAPSTPFGTPQYQPVNLPYTYEFQHHGIQPYPLLPPPSGSIPGWSAYPQCPNTTTSTNNNTINQPLSYISPSVSPQYSYCAHCGRGATLPPNPLQSIWLSFLHDPVSLLLILFLAYVLLLSPVK